MVDNTNYMVAVIILAIVAAAGIIAATLLYFMRANDKMKHIQAIQNKESPEKKYEA